MRPFLTELIRATEPVTRYLLLFTVPIVLICGLAACYKDSSSSTAEDPAAPPVSNQFQTDTIRIADLEPTGQSAFQGSGVDILNWGEVQGIVIGSRDFLTRLRGAMPGTSYQVEFCSFANAGSACAVAGQVSTDGNGDVTQQLTFPNSGSFAGVFLVQRNGILQFVTGFHAPAPASPELNVFDEDLQRAASIGGGFGPGYAPAGDDSLGSGEVEVDKNANVTLRLSGAPGSTAYAVSFCRVGMDPGGCLAVGTFTTSQNGSVSAKWPFPMQGGFAGIFFVSRQVMGQNLNQFVTGFQTP